LIGTASNRLLQNFLTESGFSPTSSQHHKTLSNCKDEPSIATDSSPKRRLDMFPLQREHSPNNKVQASSSQMRHQFINSKPADEDHHSRQQNLAGGRQ